MAAGGKVLLIACGSFNPPTYMHLRMFEMARDHLQAEGACVVGGVVSPVHDAYGKKDLASAQHRCAMARLALRSSEWVRLSEWEVRQEGWSRTRLVLDHHQRTVNEASRGELAESPGWLPAPGADTADDASNGDRDLCNNNARGGGGGGGGGVRLRLLCGADLLESFATPGLWSDDDLKHIVSRYAPVVISRSGSDSARFVYTSDVLYTHRHHLSLVTNWVQNEVSSTALRRLLRRGESAKYLTDDAVVHYARAHSLYRDTGAEYPAHLAPSPRHEPATPNEYNYKNILLSVRDPPTVAGYHTSKKRHKKSNLILSSSCTDSVAPVGDVQPKMAYSEVRVHSHTPGKAVKIITDSSENHTVVDEKVSFDVCDTVITNLTERKKCSGTSSAYLKKEMFISKECNANIAKQGNACNDSTKQKSDRFSMSSVKKSLSEVARLSERDGTSCRTEKELKELKYKTRSCNDIVKLVLTKHGIDVISDTEAIV